MTARVRETRAWVSRMSRYLQGNMQGKAAVDFAVYSYLRETLERYLGPMEGRTVLDVGTGPRYQLALLFQSLGSPAYGIDVELTGPQLRAPSKYLRLLQHDGTRRAMQVLARDLLGRDRAYFKALEVFARVPLSFDIPVSVMSVSDMSFSDQMFDALVSTTVFEHVDDVPGAAREMARVLKDGGVMYHVIHLYTSLSGGHHPAWETVGPDYVLGEVPPWDHLRGRQFPPPVYVNELRLQDYLDSFSECFDILETKQEPESGTERFLTPEIAQELDSYTQNELSCKYWHMVARKR